MKSRIYLDQPLASVFTVIRKSAIVTCVCLPLITLVGCDLSPDPVKARTPAENGGKAPTGQKSPPPGQKSPPPGQEGSPPQNSGPPPGPGPAGPPPAPEPLPIGFFVTSEGLGNGGNLGGLEGADAHCQSLAAKVGAGHRQWRAYLSTQATESVPAVNAIDRIGKGPWGNAKGVEIATSIDALKYDNSNIVYANVLTEQGSPVNSGAFKDQPNKHDILTGTQLDGTAFPAGEDRTCLNWTSASEGNSAQVGHSDRHRFIFPGSPWNSAHPSRGCSQKALEGTGGAGLFYCFATD